MGRMLLIVLAALAIAAGPALVSLQPTGSNAAAPKIFTLADFHGIRTTADIARLSFVSKRCRQWAANGEIDIDGTCLIVPTAKGGIAVIPNDYADQRKEIPANTDSGAENDDKWLTRFNAIRRGEKLD